MDRALTIGVLARRSGTNAPTIRYYEQIGLLRPAARRESGHRTYGSDDLKRLTFVRRCREFGFPIEQVKNLVDLVENGDRSCLDAMDLAKAHLEQVRRKLAELQSLETSLIQLVTACETACAGGPGPDCIILEDLAAPMSRPGCSTCTA